MRGKGTRGGTKAGAVLGSAQTPCRVCPRAPAGAAQLLHAGCLRLILQGLGPTIPWQHRHIAAGMGAQPRGETRQPGVPCSLPLSCVAPRRPPGLTRGRSSGAKAGVHLMAPLPAQPCPVAGSQTHPAPRLGRDVGQEAREGRPTAAQPPRLSLIHPAARAVHFCSFSCTGLGNPRAFFCQVTHQLGWLLLSFAVGCHG